MKSVVVEDLSISIGDYTIVDEFNLHVEEGEVVLLAGPVGSGKSTILRSIAGIIPGLYPRFKVSGKISIYGLDPVEAVNNGLVAYVPQDPYQFFIGSTLAEELEFSRAGCMEHYLRKKTRRDVYIDQLSSGELYKLLLAGAICSRARILLIDEPTGYLDDNELAVCIDSLRELACREDLTVLIADHRVDVLGSIVDRVIYLRRYPQVEQESMQDLSLGYRGREGVVLETRKLSIGYDKPLVKDIDLAIESGEIVLVYGRNGSGKTTLAKTIAGILKPLAGVVRVYGRLFYVPQKPIYWFAHDTVYGELEYYACVYGYRELDKLVNILGLRDLLTRHPYTLSIGEARILSLALAIASQPDLVVIDEPLIGLDDYWLKKLVSILLNITSHGTGILLLSHSSRLEDIASRSYCLQELSLPGHQEST